VLNVWHNIPLSSSSIDGWFSTSIVIMVIAGEEGVFGVVKNRGKMSKKTRGRLPIS